MSASLRPGRPADPSDAAHAQEHHRTLRAELALVRESAHSWRIGLGGLLLALIGFSLIRGPSEVDKVAPPWHAVIGCLLLVSLATGGYGAYRLLSAHNGRPRTRPVDLSSSPSTQNHLLALTALRDLRHGITATLLCTVFLVAAVGTTWYGPEKEKPKLLVRTATGAVLCGDAATGDGRRLTLRTKSGRVGVALSDVLVMETVEKCP
ncbi:hypothetical protein GCM10010330_55480 [Streptomyces tendae]|uniref:hypothetical protein n=1 Tax=Streptomyces tendae TaxID=1932 RepID=UPI001675A0C0|nr:hypothetical protein [Streptomyces tendae]GHA94287.1 hypothetical protein GCM10010330_55480 [Streptomyces tendae]